MPKSAPHAPETPTQCPHPVSLSTLHVQTQGRPPFNACSMRDSSGSDGNRECLPT